MTDQAEVASHIAKQHKGSYEHQGGVIEIQLSNMVIEVVTRGAVSDARHQLNMYSCKMYVAGVDSESTALALSEYTSTDIGVMDSEGNIVKPSTR